MYDGLSRTAKNGCCVLLWTVFHSEIPIECYAVFTVSLPPKKPRLLMFRCDVRCMFCVVCFAPFATIHFLPPLIFCLRTLKPQTLKLANRPHILKQKGLTKSTFRLPSSTFRFLSSQPREKSPPSILSKKKKKNKEHNPIFFGEAIAQGSPQSNPRDCTYTYQITKHNTRNIRKRYEI